MTKDQGLITTYLGRKMGPSPFRFIPAGTSKKSKGRMIKHVRKRISPDIIPTLAYAKLEGIQFYPIQSLSISLGRDSENDIVIDEAGIDRLHAKIQFNSIGQVFELFVFGRSGAYLNEGFIPEKTPAIFLNDGDNIRISEWEAVFRLPNTSS